MENGSYTIGEFARLMGVSPRTVDFYTRQGLLHPEQPAPSRGYRRYGEEDRGRLALIKQLQARKFSLREIRKMLNSSGGKKAAPDAEALGKVAWELERLQNLVQDTRSSVSLLNQPAMRALATEALQRATALCSVLVTLLQDLPPT